MSEFEKSTEEITFTVENHVGVVTLHRPAALNALSFQNDLCHAPAIAGLAG